MTRYIGPKTDGENVATQADVGGSALSDATPDALTPDQAGAAGTVNAAARADHAHEILCAAAGAILPDDSAAEGTASSFARSDHKHSIVTAAPGTILPDDVAAEGSATSFARSDHTHAIAAAAPSSNLTASTTNAEGNATSFARSNHTHAIDTAAPSANLTATTTNASGSSASLARADHSHAITTAAPGTILPDHAAATGTSASLARADHTHAISAAAAATITGTNAEGTSNSFARADHDHAIAASLLIPTGAVMPYAGSTAPTGWLLCDGSEQPVATYGALDTLLGTTYGFRTNGSGGAGSSHFRLPNLKGRVAVGRDSSDGDFDTLGETRGSKTHTLTTSEMPSHSHTLANAQFNAVTPTFFAFGGSFGQNVTGTTSSTGGDGAHNNIQPSIVLNYIIKT